MLTLKKKVLSIVLFNKKYTYSVNIIVLLVFLSLKTHTFTDSIRNLPLSLSKVLDIKDQARIFSLKLIGQVV